MEQFLESFQIHGEKSIIFQLFSSISKEWNCSHLSRECMVKGVCARQFFNSLCDQALANQDFQMAEQLEDIATIAMHDRERVWLNAIKSASITPKTDLELEGSMAVAELERLYNRYGTKDAFMTLKTRKRLARVATDDSLSMLSYFYVPVNGNAVSAVSHLTRFGDIGIAFVERTEVTGFVAFDQREIQRVLDRLRATVATQEPRCPFTGVHKHVAYMMFLPKTALELFQDKEKVVHLMRVAQQDTKMITAMRTQAYPRLMLQRYGVDPCFDFALHHLHLGEIPYGTGTTNLVLHRFFTDGGSDWRTWCLPLVVMRTARLGKALGAQICEYITQKSSCQICFLVERGCDTIPITDVRLAEMTGGDEVVYGRPIRHDDEDYIPDLRLLRAGEVYRRVGPHYLAQRVSTSREALIVSAKELHRSVRGDEHWGTVQWRKNVVNLVRLVLYWFPTSDERTQIFNLWCFALFGMVPRQDGKYTNWDDQGDFLNMMMSTQDVAPRVVGILYKAMLDLALLHLQSTAVPGVPPIDLMRSEELEIVEPVNFNFHYLQM
ncbi:NS1 [Lebombo virus]|uniref:Non-structural protein NS1 n=1 Tax=Lebombo virus TaxID=40057 RepID=W5QLY2_9REOV|nr:NS1 [Lebombo virus]AFX73380.1 NS1 [Lebombo virus]